MDVIGAYGYLGQPLEFLGPEKFGYLSGNGICVHDTNSGPKEIIWRQETGIRAFKFEPKTSRIAICHETSAMGVEVIFLNGHTLSCMLPNPTSTKILDISFSCEGERIIGISDYLDPKFIIWDISSKDVVFVMNLKNNAYLCSLNPCRLDTSLIYSDDELTFIEAIEVFGNFSSKVKPIDIEAMKALPGNQFVPENVPFIQFVIWAPDNKVLIGLSTGIVVYYDFAKTKVLHYFCIPMDPAVTSAYPTCAVLNSEFLIVGDSNGYLHWFLMEEVTSYSNVTTEAEKKVVDPRRVANLFLPETDGGFVSTLAIDALFQNIIAGTRSGAVYHLPIGTSFFEDKKESLEGEDADGERNSEKTFVLSRIEDLKPLFSAEYEPILASKIFDVRIAQVMMGKAKVTRNFFSVVAVGSFNGKITLWKTPIANPSESDGREGFLTLNKSTPGMFAVQTRLSTCVENEPAAISVIEPFPSLLRLGGRFMMVGNVTGWLECWLIEAVENEDDEGLEETSDESQQTQVKTTKHFQQQLYESVISSVVFGKDSPNIVVSSVKDPRIFILQTTVKAIDVIGCIDTSSFFSGSISISTCLFIERNIVVANRSGEVVMVDALGVNFVGSIFMKDSATSSLLQTCGKISTACVSEASTLLLCDDDAKRLKLFTFPSEVILAQRTDAVVSISSNVYDDIMLVSAISRSSHLCITGGLFGGIYIWQCSDLTRISNIRVHNCPILSVSLNANCNIVLSSGVDGSIFAESLDVHSPPLVPDGKCYLDFANEDELTSSFLRVQETIQKEKDENIPSLWSKKFELKMIAALKDSSKAKVLGCREHLERISLRLQQLLTANEHLTDLEKLDRGEFVVDVESKQATIQHYKILADELEKSFTKKNLLNETIASRIRQLCWDNMEFHASFLLPLQKELSGSVTLQSFSVQKISEAMASKLNKIKRLRAIEIRTQVAQTMASACLKVSSGASKTTWPGCLGSSTLNATWISADGLRWPVFDVVEFAKNFLVEKPPEESQAASSAEHVDADDEGEASSKAGNIDESLSLNLLYPPLAIRTDIQKRIQIALMYDVLHSIKTKFNEYFKKLRSEKEDAIASIESRNNRIQEILNDLRIKEDFFRPDMLPIELPETAVVVQDNELVSRPYETAVARAQRLKEEDIKRRRELEQTGDNVKGRALDDMMNGILEAKKNVLAEASALHRPEWMTKVSPADMTESELKEYEEFEANVKAVQEEQMKYRKMLEVELKKLRTEIADICKNFDDKLISLSKYKLITQREVLIHELYLSRLSSNLVSQEASNSQLKDLNETLVALSAQSSEAREKLGRVLSRAESLKSQLASIQEDGRAMERSFKRDLQTLCNLNFDQDSLKVFSDLYKQRRYNEEYDADEEGDDDRSVSTNEKSSKQQSKNSSKLKTNKGQSKMGGKSKLKASKGASQSNQTLGPLQEAAQAIDKQEGAQQVLTQDPFYKSRMATEKAKRQLENQIPLLAPQSIEIDCPEGFTVDQFTWAKLQELRIARIQKEIDEKLLMIRISDLKTSIDDFQQTSDSCDRRLLATNQTIISIKGQQKHSEVDLLLIAALKQGQDEVDSGSFVTGYTGAVLIPSSVVQKYNLTINQFGKEKISVLQKIKAFRRHINMIDWEANQLQLESWHLDEYFTDLQLLRVTRDFQRVIRSGADPALTKVNISEKLSSSRILSN